MDDWRTLLYYPLGLLPAIFFSSRFLIQWGLSERAHRSLVTPLFWKLSLVGNLLMLLHYFIQFQYLLAVVQLGNAVISWRNLNLIQTKRPPYTLTFTLFVFGTSFASLCMGIAAQEISLNSLNSFPSAAMPLFWWSILGLTGQSLFASRFWLQWWQAERRKKSELRTPFWILSIVGTILSLLYFFYINDTISLINHSFAIVPYVRNLILIKRVDSKKQQIIIGQ